jgi:cytosine/adenosine deaminase-related metal-dependent hydrolase
MALYPSRLLTATRIHNGHSWLPDSSCIEVSADGTIIAVHPTDPSGGSAEYFEGTFCPGFVNVHCHLELSHLKGMVPEGTGLIPFLQAILTQRNNFTDEQKKAARLEAYQELVNNGVVAVGDIANSDETLDLRLLSGLHMHTFVECIGFTEAFAQARLDYSMGVLNSFTAQYNNVAMLRQSVIPHAPYSVSAPLFHLINEAMPGSLISIHNQESSAEDEYYRSKTGHVCDLLSGLGINDEFFLPTGKSSLQSYLPYFSQDHPLILVHNTYTSAADITLAESRNGQVFWCLCPNANQYIELALPDVALLQSNVKNICIGTDSLASNYQLSVLRELQTLKRHFPFLEWEELLRWGTLNGARALQMDQLTGSFGTGKRPGILHLTDLDSGNVARII